MSCKFEVLMQTLLQAWEKHGHSREILVDNARTFRSPRLQRACLELGIHLRFRAPGSPEGGGAVERFFRTSQNSFEAELRASGKVLMLKGLNERFEAWVEELYHQEVHSAIKCSPREQYQKGHTGIFEHVDIAVAARFFLKREFRRVNRFFSDISLDNKWFRVSSSLRGERVIICYNPINLGDKIYIESLDGTDLGEGVLHQRRVSEYPDPQLPKTQKNEISMVEQLVRKHRDTINKTEPFAPNEMKTVFRNHKWSVHTFLERICRLVGRAGVSAFDKDELEALIGLWREMPHLNQTILRHAWADSGRQGLMHLISKLIDSKEQQ